MSAIENTNRSNYLDRVRVSHGPEKCRAAFREIYQNNRRQAVGLLNDPDLSFPCLFILLPQIDSLGLYPHLNSRGAAAAKIANLILSPGNPGAGYLSGNSENVRPVLKWILETGWEECGLDDGYIKVLDISLSVLINTYRDMSVLPVAADMIFTRHQKKRHVHYLLWAYFKIQDPFALKLIAEHVRSSDREERALAQSLLNLQENGRTGEEEYGKFLSWLKENDPFLYFTEESHQYASRPEIFKIDHARKYLNKKGSSYQKEPIVPKNGVERGCLEEFQALNDGEKSILSEYSQAVRKQDAAEWENWLRSPVKDQIKAAKAGLERLR